MYESAWFLCFGLVFVFLLFLCDFLGADLKEVDEVSDQLRASGITDATGPSGKFWVIGFVNCCCFDMYLWKCVLVGIVIRGLRDWQIGCGLYYGGNVI